MTAKATLAGVATLALFLAAGCSSQTDPAADNEATSTLNADDSVPEGSLDNSDTTSTVVEIIEVPAPADTSSADAAPLVEAASVAKIISAGTGIERIPHEDGWVWQQNGQIIRIASRDGRRVSYFRSGETNPYFVQDGDRAYSYSSGRVQRSYDGNGRTVTVDQSRRKAGEELARRSGEDRTQAAKVASEQPGRVQRGQPSRENGLAGDDRTSSSGQRTSGASSQQGASDRPAGGEQAQSGRDQQQGRETRPGASQTGAREGSGSDSGSTGETRNRNQQGTPDEERRREQGGAGE